MDTLESIQYQAGLICTGCWKNTSQKKLYQELGWESLDVRRHNRRIILYHKIKSGYTPDYLANYLLESHPPENSTRRYLNSFFPYCHSFWEILDPAVKELQPSQFKHHIKKLSRVAGSQHFNFKDKYGFKLLTCLRVDHSDLRDHRFKKKFNCQSPVCKCSLENESTEHYLLRCPNMLQPRSVLLEKIKSVSGFDTDSMSESEFSKLLLYGNSKLTNKKKIF